MGCRLSKPNARFFYQTKCIQDIYKSRERQGDVKKDNRPSKPNIKICFRNQDMDEQEANAKLVLGTIYILLGMGLISMCINLMQEKIVSQVTIIVLLIFIIIIIIITILNITIVTKCHYNHNYCHQLKLLSSLSVSSSPVINSVLFSQNLNIPSLSSLSASSSY
jgi:hypothetical protein